MQMASPSNASLPCLTGPMIADLHRGRLPAEELDRISTHLSRCTRCQQALSSWRDPGERDPFADRLKECLKRPAVPDHPALKLIEAAAGQITEAYAPYAETAQPGAHFAPAKTLTRIGAYDLQEVVGQGGMGVVYKARHQLVGRAAAVKMIRSLDGASDTTVLRFRREAEAIARLDHPNIVRLYDFGEEAGVPYLAMEWVAGGSLAGLLKAGPLPVRAAVTLVKAVAEAMDFAHRRDVVHRDLKPSNVLMAGDNTPKVADFGLAKLLDDPHRLSLTGGVMGTPNYMAPEQAAGRPGDISPRTDVFALGVILYETLTGKQPFQADDQAETMRLVREMEVADPSTAREEVSPALGAVCLKCMEKVPAHRYASAQLLADDLTHWLNNERPVGLPGPVTRTTRRLWRHRFLTACAVALVAVATTGATAMYLRDPDRPLREIQAELAAGKEVILIGETGKPKWHKILIGEDGTKLATATDGTFTIHAAADSALIELLPAVPFDRYRFEVEVRHEKSNAPGRVGLYIGYQQRGENDAKMRLLTHMTFNGLRRSADGPVVMGKNGPLSKGVTSVKLDSMLIFGEEPALNRAGVSGVNGPPFEPDAAPHKQWHRLAVTVSPTRVDAEWDGKVFMADTADLDRLLAASAKHWKLFNNDVLTHRAAVVEAHSPAFLPRGGVGLYLSNGSASFREAKLTPSD